MGAPTLIKLTSLGDVLIDEAVIIEGMEQKPSQRETTLRDLLVDFDASDLAYLEQGSQGAVYSGRGSYIGGVPYYRDENTMFKPYRARGNRYKHGLFEQLWRESPQYLKAWGNIEQGLITSDWWVEPAVCEDPQDQLTANAQADFIEQTLAQLEGGMTKFLTQAAYQFLGGNAPFVEVYDPNTYMLKKLSFRFPKLVQEWILDSLGQELIAVRFSDPFGNDYIVPAQHLLLYVYRQFGNDYEGNSPLRTVAQWIRAKQLFMGLQTGAGEKWGMGLVSLEYDKDSKPDKTMMARAVQALNDMVAGDGAVVELPAGVRLVLHSPAGQMPDFENIIRYCDEQITSVLKAEGSLIGLNGTGTYALADVKDREHVASIGYYSKLICEGLNGANNTLHTGPVKKSIDARWGGAPGGRYPEIKSAPQRDAQDPDWIDKLGTAKEKGLLTWTDEDEAMVRERLKLNPLQPANKKGRLIVV